MEFSNNPNDIPDNQLESKIIQICRESGVEVDHNHIVGCHRLPVSRYSRGDNKTVIVKFINQKYSETLLYKRKSISSRDFPNINIPSKIFVFVSLCPYYRLFRVSVKTFREEVQYIRCFLSVEQFSVKLSESGNPVKIYRWYITELLNF